MDSDQMMTPQAAPNESSLSSQMTDGVSGKPHGVPLRHIGVISAVSVMLDYGRNAAISGQGPLRKVGNPRFLAYLFAQRAIGAAAVVSASDFATRWARTSLQTANNESIVRGEWGASVAAGAITFGGGMLGVRKFGGRPLLGMGFLVMPSLYVCFSLRDNMTLERFVRPRSYEAHVEAMSGALPLLLLPPSLRLLLGVPLLTPGICSAWLDDVAAERATIETNEPDELSAMDAARRLFDAPSLRTQFYAINDPDSGGFRVDNEHEDLTVPTTQATVPTFAPTLALASVAEASVISLEETSDTTSDAPPDELRESASRTAVARVRSIVGSLRVEVKTQAMRVVGLAPSGDALGVQGFICAMQHRIATMITDCARDAGWFAPVPRLEDAECAASIGGQDAPVAREPPRHDVVELWFPQSGDSPFVSSEAPVVPTPRPDAAEAPERVIATTLAVALSQPPPHLNSEWAWPLWSQPGRLLEAWPSVPIAHEVDRAETSWHAALQALWLRSFGSTREDANAERSFDGNVQAAIVTPIAKRAFQSSSLAGGVRTTALSHLSGLCQVIAPILEARIAPAPSLMQDASTSNGSTTSNMGMAMQWGLLPECSSSDEELANGLEPVYGLTPDGCPYWRSHVKWFRWFASGDLALLTILLILRELH